ncbi:zinc finger protein with KRAB and SCAN domains 2-like [Ptychodera flava]|uniref:zinc finger protein with KRAB and SCAN domains 2-like n=1 Tax=Ptychodera flava TaxID=63121 RepID=UPI00396A57CD
MSTASLKLSLRKDISFTFTEDDNENASNVSSADQNSSLPGHRGSDAKETCFQECFHLWEEVKKTNQVKRLGDCFVRVTQELFLRLRNDTLSGKDKVTIVNFLCESGALQMDVAISCQGEERQRKPTNTETGSQSSSHHYESNVVENSGQGFAEIVTHHENGTYSIVPQSLEGTVHVECDSTPQQEPYPEGLELTPGYTVSPDARTPEDRTEQIDSTDKVIHSARHRRGSTQLSNNISDIPVDVNPQPNVISISDHLTEDNTTNCDVNFVEAVVFPKRLAISSSDRLPTNVSPRVKEELQANISQSYSQGAAHWQASNQPFNLPGVSQVALQDGPHHFQTEYISVNENQRKPQSQPVRAQITGHEMSRHTCKVCGAIFPSRRAWMSHMRLQHVIEKPFRCRECGNQFVNKSNLTVHKRLHTGNIPFKCNYCAKAFTTTSKLRLHQRIHTGEKPFECQHCHKRFSDKSNLKSHLKVHIGRQFVCVYCGISFSKYHLLNKHKCAEDTATVATNLGT